MTTEEKKTMEEAREGYNTYYRVYTKEYRKENPDKVKQWRKTAIVNAYKKLIAAEPQYKI